MVPNIPQSARAAWMSLISSIAINVKGSVRIGWKPLAVAPGLAVFEGEVFGEFVRESGALGLAGVGRR